MAHCAQRTLPIGGPGNVSHMVSSTRAMMKLANTHSNANYATLLDHPKTFGRPATEAWDTLWPMLKPLAEKCYGGECVYHQNDLLLYDKNERGRLREKYHVNYDVSSGN